MRTTPSLKRPRKAKNTNEWLQVIESLDAMMEQRVSSETPKPSEALLDKGTVEALNTAYAATLRYYAMLLEKGKHDARAEKFLSGLWQKAGARIRRYEPALAKRLKATNRFWSSAVTWANETIHKAWAHLNSIRTSTNILAIRADSLARGGAASLS